MTKEPILINGLSVSAAVGATLGLLDRFGVPVADGDNALVTAFIAVVVIPIGTWILARRKTVPVPKANDAVQDAIQGKRVVPFKVGS